MHSKVLLATYTVSYSTHWPSLVMYDRQFICSVHCIVPTTVSLSKTNTNASSTTTIMQIIRSSLSESYIIQYSKTVY